MNFPKPLKKGDTIAIAAPSFGATTEPYKTRFEEAIRQFKLRGYKVKVGECCYKSDGLGISTEPEIAARELMELYLDEEVSAVFSCGGGELMCEVMSFVDFEKLKTVPAKWFIGYSDNTNFIFPLVTLCNVAAIYGQNASGFGKPWEQSEFDVWNLLEGKNYTVSGYPMFQSPQAESSDPLSAYILTDKKVLSTFVSKDGKLTKLPEDKELVLSGTLLGGCLDCLVGLSGTRFDAVKDFNEKHKNVLWVLESCDYNPMDIRRALWHLKECGWFNNACGFIVGRPLAAFGQELMGVNEINAVTGILGELGVPIVLNADIGHIDPTMPLIIGSKAKVCVKGNDINISMELSD